MVRGSSGPILNSYVTAEQMKHNILLFHQALDAFSPLTKVFLIFHLCSHELYKPALITTAQTASFQVFHLPSSPKPVDQSTRFRNILLNPVTIHQDFAKEDFSLLRKISAILLVNKMSLPRLILNCPCPILEDWTVT